MSTIFGTGGKSNVINIPGKSIDAPKMRVCTRADKISRRIQKWNRYRTGFKAYFEANFQNGKQCVDKLLQIHDMLCKGYSEMEDEEQSIFSIRQVWDDMNEENILETMNPELTEEISRILGKFDDGEIRLCNQVASVITNNIDKGLYLIENPEELEGGIEKIMCALMAAFRVINFEGIDEIDSINRFVNTGCSRRAKTRIEMIEEIDLWDEVVKFSRKFNLQNKGGIIKGAMNIIRYVHNNVQDSTVRWRLDQIINQTSMCFNSSFRNAEKMLSLIHI